MTVIVCPKCAKQHQVNIANIPTGKRIVARCKACSHRFPIIMDQLIQQSSSITESDSLSAQINNLSEQSSAQINNLSAQSSAQINNLSAQSSAQINNLSTQSSAPISAPSNTLSDRAFSSSHVADLASTSTPKDLSSKSVSPKSVSSKPVSPKSVTISERTQQQSVSTLSNLSNPIEQSAVEKGDVEQGEIKQDELSGKKTAFTRRISVSLSKGGVGKTTTSVNLSAGLALAGFKVLLIDTDTQGQSAYNLGKKPSAGLTELLTGELSAQEATIEARKNLWLLAGGRSLAGVKRIIDKKSIGQEWTLSEALTGVDEQYDFVIIDTSPGWDSLTINVMFYVTEVLVPIALEAMPYQGLSEFIKSLSSIHKYRKEVALKYIVPTFMDTRVKHPQEIFKKLKQLYSEYICKPIRYNENFSEAPSYGKTIFEYAPGCNGALDYKELIRKVAQDDTLLQ